MSDSSRGRGWMLVLGAIVLMAGLIGAGALWYASSQRVDDNVADFARAPSGCVTTLDFIRTGEFNVYLETTGSFDELAGDCSADAEYDRDQIADPQIQLVDADGATVDISDAEGVSYDTGAFTGSSVGVVRIETPGEHRLTVAADGGQFAVTVGGHPNDGVGLLRWGAAAVAIVSLVVGGGLLVLGSRRPPQVASDDSLWEPQSSAATWPIGPPGFPAPPPTTGATGPAGPPMAPPPIAAPPIAPPPTAPSPWAPPSISSDA